MNTLRPEQTGEAFKALSYIFKHLADPLIADIDSLRKYYGPLLGHKRDFVRQFAAETFAPLIRRLPPKALQKHTRAILKALAAACRPQVPETTGVEDDGETGRAAAEAAEAAAEAAVVKAGRSIIDGVAQLFSEIAQGTSNSLHSKAELIIRAVVDAVMSTPPPAASWLEPSRADGFAKRVAAVLEGSD